MNAEDKIGKLLDYIENRDTKLYKRVNELREYERYDLAEMYEKVREELETIRWIIEEEH